MPDYKNNIEEFLKTEKITAERIKDSFFYIYRFTRGLFVASEVSYKGNISDIVLSTKDFSRYTNIEIKISKSDFLHDFEKDRYKLEKSGITYPFHKFYFCVPSSLVSFALNYLNLNYKEAGLIECTNSCFDSKNPLIRSLHVVKKAYTLVSESIEDVKNFKYTFILRLTSELANEKLKKYKEFKIL